MKALVGLILALLSLSLEAKEVNGDQVRAAYVYNFLRHTTWENESKLNDYHLMVVSSNENLKNMFSMLSSRKLLKDKKIKVSFYDGKTSLKNIQALYVDEKNANVYEKLFDEYESSNVLFISDQYKDKKKVMINLLENSDIVTFEINKANILNRSLRVSPDLVLLGGSEIDVAKLYKKSQDELREQKETVAGLSKKIKAMNSELEEKMGAIGKQKEALIEQRTKIDLQSSAIAKQLEEITTQKKTIFTQQTELEEIQKNIEIQKQKLVSEEKNIKEKEAILRRLLTSREVKQNEIDNANTELELLNNEIEAQKEKLVQKEGVITTQRGAIGTLLFFFAIIALLILYVVKQNKLLNTLSQTDLLTGLFNRRVLMDKIKAEVLKYNRYKTPFSILFIDVDYFKMINDSYGHDKGDKVLKVIASLMKKNTRETDVCVRWGGEEFMILANNTDLENAVKLAENFRSIIENHDFDLGKKVTVSIGIATIKKGQDKEALVKVADNALYIAKESGRNCIIY